MAEFGGSLGIFPCKIPKYFTAGWAEAAHFWHTLRQQFVRMHAADNDIYFPFMYKTANEY